MDIEGSEYQLLPHLFETRAICHVDALFVEAHPQPGMPGMAWFEAKVSEWGENIAELCRGKPGERLLIVAGESGSQDDDESYVDDGMPLPVC